MNGQRLEEVTSFKYPTATLCNDGTCSSEVRISNGQTKQDLVMQHHQLASKFKLYKSLVTSILYGCEAWTLLADSEKRIQAFETKCLRKHPRFSYLEHKTNDWVRSQINFLVGPQEPLPATIKRRKLAWFGHVTHHDSLSKTILRGSLEGGRRRGRQRKCCMENIKEWTSLPMPELLTKASSKKDWKTISADVPPTT